MLVTQKLLSPMSEATIDKIKELENFTATLPQNNIPIDQFIHDGVYARTIVVPAGVLITGALMRIPTIVIVSGHSLVYTGHKFIELKGYHVMAAPAPRKQIFVALMETSITMLFKTAAKDVKEAEKEFTDEWELLGFHNRENAKWPEA